MISKKEQKARLQEIKRLAEAGVTYAEIGARFGISRQRVQQIVIKNNIKKKLDSEFLKEDRKRTWALFFEKGYTIKDVAELEGLSYRHVAYYCRKNNIKKPMKLKDIHGTVSSYNSGCRCDECKRAKREYKAKLKFKPVPNHGNSGYMNYGCRCDVCKTERSKAQKAEKERRKARKVLQN